jgi:flagellar biogenesis protein FliO
MQIAGCRWMLAAIALAAWMQPAWCDAPAASPNTPVQLESVTPGPAPAAAPVAALEATAPPLAADDAPPAPAPLASSEGERLALGPRTDSSEDEETDPRNSGSWMLQTLTALGVVLVLIFLLRNVLRRIAGPAAPSSPGGLVEVLARTPIGGKTYIVFLKIADHIVVASQGPAGMQPLTTLDDPEDVAQVLTQVRSHEANSISASFRKMLQGADGHFGESSETGADNEEQYVDRTRDQLSSLLGRMRTATQRLRGGRS